MLDAKFWRKTGIDVVACYRRHIFDPEGGGKKATDIDGSDYPRYSNKYELAKRTGKLKRQATKFKDSNAPVLTSDLLRAFKSFKSYNSGFGFGAITHKGQVKNLAKKGRVLYKAGKPLPKQCEEFLMKEMDDTVKGAFKKLRRKIKRKKINIII